MPNCPPAWTLGWYGFIAGIGLTVVVELVEEDPENKYKITINAIARIISNINE